MDNNSDKIIPPGWKGGFESSNKAFAYPDPDLSSLPLLGNMDNIDKLDRQQPAKWPEFSWETQKGQPDPKRCYTMFAPYISRIGYTDDGRIYSIICPQQGIYVDKIGCMNVEVTVTGQRGWVNESDRTVAADMMVEGKIWFSPSAHENLFVRHLWDVFSKSDLPFPSQKSHAIIVSTHLPGNPEQPVFPGRKGISPLFPNPEFALHHDEAWTVGNIAVEIGPIKKTGNALVDEFNQLVMDAFNMASGNMLQTGNILTWNIWFSEPVLVVREEWRTHAKRWRDSIDEGHGSPDGNGVAPRLFDGTEFSASKNLIESKILEMVAWLMKHLWKH